MSRKDNNHKINVLSKSLDIPAIEEQLASISAETNTWKLVYHKNGLQAFTKKNVFGGIFSFFIKQS